MSSTQEIDRERCLYLTELGEPEDNSVRFVLAAAHTPGPPEDSKIGDHVIPGTREIVADESTPAWEVIFHSYIAYSVRNESFTVADQNESHVGNLFRTYSRSKFLDFVSLGTIADDQHPGPFVHYSILCLNHIIGVASTEPPEIRKVRAGAVA